MNAAPPRRLTMVLVADLVTLALALAALGLLVSGGFREVIGGAPVSITWLHAAFVAAAVAAVRHAAVPRPGLPRTIGDARQWLRARPALSDATLVFWVTRPAVPAGRLAGRGHLRVSCGGPGAVCRSRAGTRAAGPMGRTVVRRHCRVRLRMAVRFDRQQNLAFFPAYPILIRGAGLGPARSGRGFRRTGRLRG